MISPHADTDGHVAALIRARQTLQSDPHNPTAFFEQALALCQLGKWEQALDSWRQVVSLEPDNAFAYINMGVVLLEQGQWAQAEQVFARAAHCRADQPSAHYGLGMAYAQQGLTAEARDAWERTLQLDPAHRDAKTNLAVLDTLAAEDTPLPPLECVVTSQVNLLATPETALAAAQQEHEREHVSRKQERADRQTQASKVFMSESDTSQKPRIPLPPVVGPSLSAIVGTVMTAQNRPMPDSSVSCADSPAADHDGKPSGQATVEPTLKLDAKTLQQGHRTLKRQERATLFSLVSRQHLPAIGMAAVGLLILAGWKMQMNRTPTASVMGNKAAVTAALPATALTAPAASGDAAQPAESSASLPVSESALVPPASSSPGLPRRTKLAEALPAANSESRTLRPQALRVPAQHEAAQTESPDVRSHSPRPRRAKRVTSVVEAKREVAPRQQSAPKHPGIPRHSVGDEDTFAAHPQPRHSDSGEEWTDKIP